MDEHCEQLITCPITYQIFKHPVVATDGIIYEKEAIEEWYSNKNISPWTKLPIIDKRLIPIVPMKEFVNQYLLTHPNKISDQFVPEPDPEEIRTRVINNKKSILKFNAREIKCFITKVLGKKHDYAEIDLINVFENNKMTRHIIETLDDHNITDMNGWSLAHYVFYLSSYKNIKLLCQKGIDINAENEGFNTPIHLLCYRESNNANILPIFKFLVEETEVDLYQTNDDGWNAIHIVFRYGSPMLINYLYRKMNKEYLNLQVSEVKSPIQLLMARYSDQKEKFYSIIKPFKLKPKINFDPNIVLQEDDDYFP